MSRRSALIRLIISLVVIGGSVFIWLNRQNIIDWARLRTYDPPAEIEQLASDTTMVGRGRKLFYVNHPRVEPRGEFSQNCPQGEQTIVLGCYIKNKAIYIFDVTDARLNGIKQVTAAHEMLHAAYDRLDKKEKTHVNGLITHAYADVTDERIRATVETYRQAGADTTNELHSILGTEVRQLPAELETYYQRYFENRLKIVEYAETYESVFTEKQRQQEELLNRINSLKQELSSEREAIERQEAALRAERSEIDQLAASGQTTEYNARVPGYNAQITSLQNRITRFNQNVELVNQLVNEYNELGAEQAELFKAIDSRSLPQTQ